MSFRLVLIMAGVSLALSSIASAQNPNWPNAPDADPLLEPPSDHNFVKYDGDGKITGGQWNLWSFVPAEWAQNKDFRQDEIALGTGIHADRAWQRTIGDRSVVIAVLDSGIKWNEGSLQMKYYLKKAELTGCMPKQTEPAAADDWGHQRRRHVHHRRLHGR